MVHSLVLHEKYAHPAAYTLHTKAKEEVKFSSEETKVTKTNYYYYYLVFVSSFCEHKNKNKRNEKKKT